MKSNSPETQANFFQKKNPQFVDPECRRQMIEEAAYFRAESKGFPEGCALSDWLEAEAEIDQCYPILKKMN